MKKNFYFPSSDGVTKIHGIAWIPEGEIKAVLQLTHGMIEFIDRYDQFAQYLNGFGICVIGNDHLGHGESVAGADCYGYFKHPDGNECLIKDMHRLRRMTQKKYQNIPYFMLGHSMGSFLIRKYMMLHGEGLAGVIVMGTGSQPPAVLTFGKLLCRGMALVKGWKYRSSFVNGLVFSSSNKKVKKARTPQDWLTKDEDIVDMYRAHKWCTFIFTLDGFYQLFRTIQFVQNKKHIRQIPRDLPVLLVSGKEDSVGNYGKGVESVYRSYQAAGIADLRMKLYENDRHEILNETDRDVVYEDLRKWIEDHKK